jgi:hypothetical protein
MGAQIKIGQDGRNMILWNFTFSLLPLHIPTTVVGGTKPPYSFIETQYFLEFFYEIIFL